MRVSKHGSGCSAFRPHPGMTWRKSNAEIAARQMSTHTTFPLAAETDAFFKLAVAFGVLVAGLEIGIPVLFAVPV